MALSDGTIWIIVVIVIGVILLGILLTFLAHKRKGRGGYLPGTYFIGGDCGFPHDIAAAPFTGGSEGIYFGGGNDPEAIFYGGASTANLVLLKKHGGEYKVAIGRLKEHGNRLQLPSGFVETDEDMEHAALRGASGMMGEDLLSSYYGKGKAKTTLYKDTPETKRGNVVIVLDKDEKYNNYEQNNELDPTFSKSDNRIKWISTKDIVKNNSIKGDNGDCVTIPFYLERTIKETVKNIK